MANSTSVLISFVVAYLCIISLCRSVRSASTCPLQFKDCGSKAGSLSTAMFNGTCEGGKAKLVQGTVVSIAFGFKTKNDEAKLTSVVHGKIGELPFVPFPLGNADACVNSGLKCPVTHDTSVVYSPVLNILSSYPKVNVIVKWQLQNKDKTDVFCALIPASITSA